MAAAAAAEAKEAEQFQLAEEMEAAAILILEQYRLINEGAAELHEKAQQVLQTYEVTKTWEDEQQHLYALISSHTE